MQPEHWRYLAKNRRLIIHRLKNSAAPQTDSKRWAKQLVYQFAVLYVAKHGYRKAQLEINWIANRAGSLKMKDGALYSNSPDQIARHMLIQMSEMGGDAFAVVRQASKDRGARAVDAFRGKAKYKWWTLAQDFQKAFGSDQLKRFESKHARYLEVGTRYSAARSRFKEAMKLRGEFRQHIKP